MTADQPSGSVLNYFAITPRGGSATISASRTGSPGGDVVLEYSTDGKNWRGFGSRNPATVSEKTYFRRPLDLSPINYFGNNPDTDNYWRFNSSAAIDISGDLRSLFDGNSMETAEIHFAKCLFQSMPIVDASELLIPGGNFANCYEGLFLSCSQLTGAPELPTVFGESGFREMFTDCTALVTPPALLSTNLQPSCYMSMFSGCTSLASLPLWPVTDSAHILQVPTSAFEAMFNGCSSLTDVSSFFPTDYITHSGDRGYCSTFRGCTSLITLPSSIRCSGNYAAAQMFQGCTSLTTVSNLQLTVEPGRTYEYIFQDMFSSCSALQYGLTTLPFAGAVPTGAYYTMFAFTGLVSTPPLNFSSVGVSGCYGMFRACESLVSCSSLEGKGLNSANISSSSYQYMFQGCTSLQSVGVESLPANTVSAYTYESMFQGCSSLSVAPRVEAEIFDSVTSPTLNTMFSGCSAITGHRFADLDRSVNVFVDNSSCLSLQIDAVVPSTAVVSATLAALPQNCIFYVPAESVETYKTTLPWSNFASRIQAIPES